MAEGLLDDPEAIELIDEARQWGVDLVAELQGTDEALRATTVAQPTLLFVEITLAGQIPRGLDIAAVAGHSSGEYAAAVAAGALAPREAMRLVIARAAAMAASGRGTMTALLGVDERIAVVANINGPGQMVISGSAEAVAVAATLAGDRGLRRAVPLNVSGGFHSPLMADAAAEFAARLDEATIADPAIPIVCNVDGAAVTTATELRDRLKRQLSSPVRWTDCVIQLVALGAEALVEVGPGSVLTGMARRIAPDVLALPVSTVAAAHDLSTALAAGAP
jgi:[acyl-carrier-protein] S-malonyltransferase